MELNIIDGERHNELFHIEITNDNKLLAQH